MSTKRIKLLTQNTWHGLDYSKHFLMLPAESSKQRANRFQSLLKLLDDNFISTPASSENSLDVIFLQEVNPCKSKLNIIKQHLKMNGFNLPVNVGFKVGEVGYPFQLNEGLVTIWNNQLSQTVNSHTFLSGFFKDFKIPFSNITGTFQFNERRAATAVVGSYSGKKFAFINVHLHHGTASVEANLKRRIKEIDNLCKWLLTIEKNVDLVFVGGDFNCEQQDSEMAKFLKQGYVNLSTNKGKRLVTWDPSINPLGKIAPSRGSSSSESAYNNCQHQLDNIYCKATGEQILPSWDVSAKVVYDENTWISDHFGILVDIQWN